MNIKQLYDLAKVSPTFYDFENIIGERYFNRPCTEDTTELTNKLYLKL